MQLFRPAPHYGRPPAPAPEPCFPRGAALHAQLRSQAGVAAHFQVLADIDESNPFLEGRLFEEFFEEGREKPSFPVEIVVENKFSSEEEALPLGDTEAHPLDPLSHVHNVNDFQDFLKQNYRAYLNLLDPQAEASRFSFEGSPLTPLPGLADFDIEDARQWGAHEKQEKITIDTQGSLDKESHESDERPVFVKKTRIILN